MSTPIKAIQSEAPRDCDLCPRLVAYRKSNREKHPDWFNGAVPSFGADEAQFLIIGLAPGMTGANRTGRPFTGDAAGNLLYETLEKFNFSNEHYNQRADDGLVLQRTMITNAVRCVPPQNKPIGEEINQCRPFLKARIDALPKLKIMLALGGIAHKSTIAAFGERQKDYPFGHGNRHEIGDYVLYDSYHCSRYNTQTKRLTPQMFEAVFQKIQDEL